MTATSAPAARQRPLGRAQVARAVVEHDDAWTGHGVEVYGATSGGPATTALRTGADTAPLSRGSKISRRAAAGSPDASASVTTARAGCEALASSPATPRAPSLLLRSAGRAGAAGAAARTRAAPGCRTGGRARPPARPRRRAPGRRCRTSPPAAGRGEDATAAGAAGRPVGHVHRDHPGRAPAPAATAPYHLAGRQVCRGRAPRRSASSTTRSADPGPHPADGLACVGDLHRYPHAREARASRSRIAATATSSATSTARCREPGPGRADVPRHGQRTGTEVDRHVIGSARLGDEIDDVADAPDVRERQVRSGRRGRRATAATPSTTEAAAARDASGSASSETGLSACPWWTGRRRPAGRARRRRAAPARRP